MVAGPTIYGERVRRLQEILREQGLGAAVFGPTGQMRYLSGWAENGYERILALFVPAEGEPVFLVPAINAEQAQTNPAGIADVRGWQDAAGWHTLVGELLAGWSVAERGLAIDDALRSDHLLGLQALAPGVRCVPAGALMATLREIKSADEIERMAASGALTDGVCQEAIEALREGMTELELQEVVRVAYVRRGVVPEFAILCFGPNSALPHHHSGSTRLKRGDLVLIDIGCILEGYNSDLTRTVAFGEPDPEARRVYQVVYEAHSAAYRAIAPGVACEEVDRAARSVIERAGYGPQFIHRTGHGIGLEEHEAPYIVEGNRQPLQSGMCFTDEPGVYLPGRFGVRIENSVTVTAEGARSFNAAPPQELPVVHA